MRKVSELDLWGPADNRVIALPPCPGDLFVVTTLFGQQVFVQPITEFENAVRLAEAFTRRVRGNPPAIIKILCLSLLEAQSLGFAPMQMFENVTPAQEEKMRMDAITMCTDLLHNSNDAAVRADALKLLTDMGLMQ